MTTSFFRVFFPVVLIAVLAAALLGFSVMQDGGHMMAGCLGAAGGADCTMLSPLAHFAAHMEVFHGMSSASFPILLAFLLLALFFVIASPAASARARGEWLFQNSRRLPEQATPLQRMRWFALHEKRDPSASPCAT